MRTFYKTTITLTVLSERPITGWNLGTIVYEMENGELVGNWDLDQQLRSPKEMVEDLLEAGSEPGFFMLDYGLDPDTEPEDIFGESPDDLT